MLTKSWSFPLSHPRNSLIQIRWFIMMNKSLIRKGNKKQLSNYSDWNVSHITYMRGTEWQNAECSKRSNKPAKYTPSSRTCGRVTVAAQDFLTSLKLTVWVSETVFSSIFTTSNSDELSCKHKNSQCCNTCSDRHTRYQLVKNILQFTTKENNEVTFTLDFHSMLRNNMLTFNSRNQKLFRH